MSTDESTQPLVGEKGSNAKYIKRKLLGSGSYGTALLVERASDNEIYVAKIMDLGQMSARDKQYAYSEIKCLAACDHPNIVQYLEDREDEAEGNITIIMEFADAGDLDRQIKSRQQEKRYFQEHEALFLFIQMALSLHHVHEKKMLHRDIKSANILLSSNGLIKLADFGFSHQYNDTVSGKVASTFLGTPYYLAPEIWKNQRYSKKADVWSLGVLLYETVALDRPFTAGNMKGLMQKICSGVSPNVPSKFSTEMNDLIKQILIVDPNKRPSIDDIFQIPYVRKGLQSFKDTINRNAKLSDAVKKQFMDQIAGIENGTSNTSGTTTAGSGSPNSEGALPAGAEPVPVGEINKSIGHEGVVYKLSPTANGTAWKEKYLVLARGYLVLCDKKGEEKNGKALNLTQVQSVVPVPKSNAKKEGVMSLNTLQGKSMWLQAPTKKEMEDWIGAIHKALGI